VKTMLRPGETIAGYRVEDVLGGGGMGVVYRATQLSLGRTVALKVLAPHLSSDDAFRERFRREAALQARLEHPHIVTVYEAGESEEGLYLALRLVEGTDLRRLIDSGTLAPERALRLLAQIASVLDAAHENGLVHRDVKPQNILVDERDDAYLADFGLTKSSGSRGLTQSGAYVGSLDYAAPEQVRGEPFTPAADRYAFAAVLYEALVGEVPFPRETEAALLFAHVSEPPPRPSARPGVPAALDDVVARGLAKDPEDRYESAGGLVLDARAALASAGNGVSATASVPTRPRPFGETVVDTGFRRRAPKIVLERERKLPALWVLVAAVLLCIGLAVAGFLLGHSRTHESHPPLGVAVAGPLSLSFPTNRWRATDPRPVRGLALQDPVALATRGGTLTAGVAGSTDAYTLLPSSYRARGGRERVRLGAHHALRYRTPGMWLYTVPVGRGSAIVVCRGAAVLALCESVAATLVLRGVRDATVGPDPRYAAALNGILRRFVHVRRAERGGLAHGKSAGERAGHAEVLASALATTGAQVATLLPGARERTAQAQLVTALAHARDAYVALAATLRAGDRTGYLVAATRVRTAEAAAEAALRSLRALGYRVRGAR
jgi:serine/threonine kinase PknH